MENEKRLIDANELWHKTFSCDEVAEVRKFIEQAPTVDAVEVVHGKWIKTEVGSNCSACGLNVMSWSGNYDGYEREKGICLMNYCPNCGAKMDGGNEDAEM